MVNVFFQGIHEPGERFNGHGLEAQEIFFVLVKMICRWVFWEREVSAGAVPTALVTGILVPYR